MKKILRSIAFLVLVVGCITIPKYRTALDPGEEAVTYIESHQKNKADAFVAANSFIAKSFNSARDVIQMSDKEAGAMIVKAAYSYSYTYDPIMQQRNTDWMNYTLTVQVKDQKVKIEFNTGTVSSGGYYLPKEFMPGLLEYYKAIKDGLMKELAAKREDF